MGYYIDYSTISIPEFLQKIKTGYLLPGHRSLKENADEIFHIIETQNIHNLMELQNKLKTKNSVQYFAAKSGISENYLTILRREINSYQPKPVDLSAFTMISDTTIEHLRQAGIRNTLQLFERIRTKQERNMLADETGVPYDDVLLLAKFTNLVRIKWVGAAFAVLLVESGYDTLEKISSSSGQEICKTLKAANEEQQIYKGKIGENDMQLLVCLSKDIPISIEFDE